MIFSVRKFLLINLLLAITITTTLTAIGNYYWDKKDIERHMDAFLSISALTYQALLGNDIHQRKLNDLQTSLDSIPYTMYNTFSRSTFRQQPSGYYLKNYQFQVLTDQGQILLHSATQTSLDQLQHKLAWRVVTTYNPNTHTKILVAEHDDTRRELAFQIAINDLYILFFTFPLTGLLIWFIIGRGMGPLDKVTKEVAHREPNHLHSVVLEKIPKEIKPLVDELNHLFNRLQETFEREQRFTADAAHELRTPLAAIKVQAQVALNSNELDEKNNALQKLIVSVHRSTHIVQQLLTMSRLLPEANRFQALDDIHLTKITHEILVMLAPSAIDKQIELEFEPSPNIPPFKGNPTAIGILVRNLIDNAIRYTRSGGHVIVRVYAQKKEIVLDIQDNGPGIPKELRTRVFERFFRVLGNKTSGSGLGLSIVREICALHQGRVLLQSPKKGKGLIVKVFFPGK